MESTPIKINYTILSRVVAVEELSKVTSGRKVGNETILDEVSLGWHVLFEGSHERLFFGYERPALNVGDKVKITFEKVSP